jgi:hypothetical protein
MQHSTEDHKEKLKSSFEDFMKIVDVNVANETAKSLVAVIKTNNSQANVVYALAGVLATMLEGASRDTKGRILSVFSAVSFMLSCELEKQDSGGVH